MGLKATINTLTESLFLIRTSLQDSVIVSVGLSLLTQHEHPNVTRDKYREVGAM